MPGRPDIQWNNAYQPTLGAAGAYLHLPEFLIWMTIVIGAVCVLRLRTTHAGESACATVGQTLSSANSGRMPIVSQLLREPVPFYFIWNFNMALPR